MIAVGQCCPDDIPPTLQYEARPGIHISLRSTQNFSNLSAIHAVALRPDTNCAFCSSSPLLLARYSRSVTAGCSDQSIERQATITAEKHRDTAFHSSTFTRAHAAATILQLMVIRSHRIGSLRVFVHKRRGCCRIGGILAWYGVQPGSVEELGQIPKCLRLSRCRNSGRV